ncbi:hypothetical protein ABPG72_015370 [Tetrahymena utriculariae]
MQEDFPCQIGQDSYQMHIEPDEITSQIPMNPTQTRFKSLRSNINEVEIPKNQKAIVQLDNNISLCLDVKHSLLETSYVQNGPLTQLPHNNQNLEGLNNQIDSVRVSVGTKFELKDNIFTSVVSIQIKDQIYNIISNMSFINQLKNSQTEGQFQELLLTNQNLQNLPDDSGKIKSKQMEIRKVSNNSNDSDETQPVTSAQTEVILNTPGIYNCTKCGAENKVQLNDSMSNQKQNIQQTNVNFVSQELNQMNSYVTEQQINGIPKQQVIENQSTQEDKGIFSNKLKRVRKQALRSDQSYCQEINNRINEKPMNQINIKSEQIEQSNRSSVDQQIKSELIPTQQYQIEEPYKYQDCFIRDFFQICEQIQEKQERGLGSSQLPSEAKKLNSGTNQQQTDSNYHQLYQFDNSSQICGQNYLSKDNSIISDILINQGAQISQQQNSSQSILLKDDQKSDQQFLLNKSNKKILSNNSNQTANSNRRKSSSKVMSDITNFDNIPFFSYTSFASSPNLNSQQANIISLTNQIKLYENNQSQNSNSYIQIDSELQKENEVSNQNTQLSFDQKHNELFHNSDEGEEDDEIFTDEFIAKADKKNIVKNFVKAFTSEVKKDENILNSLDEFNQKESKKSSYSQKLKKFQNYMKKSKFNNLFIKQLISNSEYSSIFQLFLLNKADDWLKNSNVQDKETHRKLLKFFQKAIHKEELLSKLKTLKRSKRNPNSSTLKANQNTPCINSLKKLASSERIPPFTNISSQLSEIQYCKAEEKSLSQLPDGETLVSDSKIILEEQKDESINTSNCIPSIQQALNGIQINNQYYLIQQHESKNNP